MQTITIEPSVEDPAILNSIGVRGTIDLERRASTLAAKVAHDAEWRRAFRAGWDAACQNFTHDRDGAFDHSGSSDRVAFVDGWEARHELDSW